MEFLDIPHDAKVYPGEYLLHEPTRQIVMCGAFKKAQGSVKFLAGGRMHEDKLENFKKLKLNREERRLRAQRSA